jgi:dinuclear metal center YbgI/SA1388 family protein
MLTAKLSDLVGIINKIAPPHLAEDWDNVGLQVGDPGATIKRIMVALDPGAAAIAAAIDGSCQLLVSHHPLIFKPLKRITTQDETGRLIHRAIAGNLAIVSAHTNFDTVDNGVNDLLAAALGVTGCVPLKVVHRDALLKLAVYVPQSHQEALLEVLLPFAAAQGSYADCSFRVVGTGTFKPLDGSAPFIGTVGRREQVEECRIELLLRKEDLSAALKALGAAHPYEEPAFDIIPLLNEGAPVGIGRIGRLASPLKLQEFAPLVKERLGTASLRVVGDLQRPVAKVALCGGSGASLLREAVRQGADLFVTGDIKYHEAQEAEALGIALCDAGHFATERLVIEGLSQQLEKELSKKKLAAEVLRCEVERDPFVAI